MSEAVLHTDKKTNTKKKIFFGVSAFIVIILLTATVAVSAYINTLNTGFSKAERAKTAEIFPEDSARPANTNTSTQNILLLGSDSREQIDTTLENIRGQRADTIMLAHLPADRKSVQIMSIMRDYWVDIPGYGTNKINAALAYGGVPLLVQTIENMLQVRIDHVMVIDFDGFSKITDTLGGVTVHNEQAFTEGKHSFAAGDIELNGAQALSFVRSRYQFADGDYTRVKNQQAYLRGVMNKIFTKETLTNPNKIAEIVAELSPYLIVDEELTTNYLLKIGLSYAGFAKENVRFFTAPTNGTGMEGSQSVVYPDWEALTVLKEHLQTDSVDQYVPQN